MSQGAQVLRIIFIRICLIKLIMDNIIWSFSIPFFDYTDDVFRIEFLINFNFCN